MAAPLFRLGTGESALRDFKARADKFQNNKPGRVNHENSRCPLTPRTFHLIDAESIAKMKKGAMIINTSRGALVDASAVIEGLKSGQIGYLGRDVYEQEADLFYENLSERIIQDDALQRLVTIPNVIVTSHQAYFTDQALENISDTTVANLTAFERGDTQVNEVTLA